MRLFRLALAALTLGVVACGAQTVDDFSADDWKAFSSTPGTLTAAAGKLNLIDGTDDPDWFTVSKTFTVDFDQTPFFLVQVTDLTERGTVKLIRKNPDDKRTAIEIDREGLYAVDMRQYKWTGSAPVEVCLYAIGNESEITYGYVKFAAALTPEDEAKLKEREMAGNPKLQTAPFELVPLFTGCSVYFQSEQDRPDLTLEYRPQGRDWQPGFPLVWVPEDSMYRGSIVRLDEDTAYEVRLREGDQTLEQGTFRTWASEVPIARTIVLDETNFTGRLTIRDKGTPDGWIKVTAKPGFVLRNDRSTPLIELSRAEYVILDGLTLRGGNKDAISVERCEHIRIVNCDIAGWGRDGTPRYDNDGVYYTADGQAINWDTAIRISRSVGTVVERCFIHDPVSTANSWYYAHPAGPQAVGIDKPEQTVIRYNDFIGSDEHRWNDAIEGAGNFHTDGGFNRDAEIYGEFHCFANDDAIEIDGGQINVRVFDNKFEGCLCGISIQGCMAGPSYLYDNLLVNMGDERNRPGQTIKTSSYANGPSAVSFVFNNTTSTDSGDLNFVKNLRIVAKNNIFAGSRAIGGRSSSPQSEGDYNLMPHAEQGEEPHAVIAEPGFVDAQRGRFDLTAGSPAIGQGVPLPNFTGDGPVDLGAIPHGAPRNLPVRPLPVSVDSPQVVFSASDVQAAPSQTITATAAGEGFSGSYRIAQNEAFDWFTVTPAAGTLKSGESQPFTVTVDPTEMTARKRYKGAFLIRFADGLSRPVTVYADTDYVQPTKPARDGVWAQYLEAETPSGGKTYEVIDDADASGGKAIKLGGPEGKDPAEYRFKVPKDGVYHVLIRLRADEPLSNHDSVQFALDDLALDRAQLRAEADWSWCMLAQNRAMSLICLQPFKLTAGEHVVKLAPREELYVDLVAMTDNPNMFE